MSLPAHIKTSSKFSDFTRNLKAFNFSKLRPAAIVTLVYSYVSICFLAV